MALMMQQNAAMLSKLTRSPVPVPDLPPEPTNTALSAALDMQDELCTLQHDQESHSLPLYNGMCCHLYMFPVGLFT